MSWSAACAQANRCGLIGADACEILRHRRPTKAEYVELAVSPVSEPEAPFVPGAFARAILSAYRHHKIAARRAIELLRGTLGGDELPDTDDLPRHALRAVPQGGEAGSAGLGAR